MNSKRISQILTALLALILLAGVGLVVYGNQLFEKRAQRLHQLKIDDRLLEEQQAALIQANKDIQKYSELERLAKSIVPQDKDQARAVREILKIAEDTRIPIASISFPASTLGAPVPGAPASGSNSPSPSTSTNRTPATTTPSISQLKPVVGMPGLYSLDVTVQSNSNNPQPYSNLIAFLAKLEQNRRTAQVTQLVITPYNKDIRLLSFTLTIKVFVKP